MTISTDVTSTTSTMTRAFTGMLEVGDETVPATVAFSDRSVSLSVADDEVGTWPASDVDFAPADEGCEIRAEGDSIRFLPDEPSEFIAYLRSPFDEPTPAPAQEPGKGATSHQVGAGPVFEPLGEDLPRPGGENEPADSTTLLDDDTGTDEGTEQEPGLVIETPDEYYAAGFNGPPTDNPGPAFGTAPPPSPERPMLAHAGDAADPETTPRPDPTGDRVAAHPEMAEPASRGFDTDSLSPPEEVPALPPIEAAPTLPRKADQEEAPPVAADPAPPEEENAPVDAPTRAKALTRLLDRARSGPEVPDEPVEDELPKPMDERQSLRQWGLVLAGGVVLLVIVGVVAWGLISMLGNEDPAGADVAAEPMVTTVAASPPTTAPVTVTTMPVTTTTVTPENQAGASRFVAAWNALAADYAYHLSIQADSLPISTAPAPTVHLTYGEDGVLLLTMAPKGTGDDRDILLAMGLAVAWADPSLSPEGRKDVLASMGVDVDEPQVADMGGDVVRNGVAYSTTVTEDVIRFEVSPPA